MKSATTAAVVVALALLAGPKSNAQVVVTAVPGGVSTYADSPYVSYQFYPYNYRYPYTFPFMGPPYSYWAAYPYPARVYSGYGSNDFPYYGRAYGSPSDPWTWPYMSAAYQYDLRARYYYPPVQ